MIFDHYHEPIYRFIASRVHRPSDAEDLTQLVFVKVLEALPRYEPRGVPFGGWLFRLARNAVIDFVRTRHEHAELEAVRRNGHTGMPVRTRSRSSARSSTPWGSALASADGRATRGDRAALLRRTVGPRGGRGDGQAGRNRSRSPVQGDRGACGASSGSSTKRSPLARSSARPGRPGRRTMDDAMQASIGGGTGDRAAARCLRARPTEPGGAAKRAIARASHARGAPRVRRSGRGGRGRPELAIERPPTRRAERSGAAPRLLLAASAVARASSVALMLPRPAGGPLYGDPDLARGRRRCRATPTQRAAAELDCGSRRASQRSGRPCAPAIAARRWPRSRPTSRSPTRRSRAPSERRRAAIARLAAALDRHVDDLDARRRPGPAAGRRGHRVATSMRAIQHNDAAIERIESTGRRRRPATDRRRLRANPGGPAVKPDAGTGARAGAGPAPDAGRRTPKPTKAPTPTEARPTPKPTRRRRASRPSRPSRTADGTAEPNQPGAQDTGRPPASTAPGSPGAGDVAPADGCAASIGAARPRRRSGVHRPTRSHRRGVPRPRRRHVAPARPRPGQRSRGSPRLLEPSTLDLVVDQPPPSGPLHRPRAVASLPALPVRAGASGRGRRPRGGSRRGSTRSTTIRASRPRHST